MKAFAKQARECCHSRAVVQHCLTTFLSSDVMRFLGRNMPPNGNQPSRLQAEVVKT